MNPLSIFQATAPLSPVMQKVMVAVFVATMTKRNGKTASPMTMSKALR
jgi:hypothetical protein